MDEREQLIGEVITLYRDVGRELHRWLPREWLENELTMPQYKTMLVLYCTERASMGALADTLGTGVSTVTGIVDRLVEHGLVTREEDPADRRVVVGRLTPAGAALVDRLILATRGYLTRVIETLSNDELRLVAEAMTLLRDAATRAVPVAPAIGNRAR
jgi:DNA-binding MarR family transcriptional regulator